MYLKEEKLTELISNLKEKEIFIKGEIISSTDIHDVLQVNKEKETDFLNLVKNMKILMNSWRFLVR